MVSGAVTFVAGVSGASITLGSVELRGMALAAVAGIGLSLIFWILDRFNLMNEEAR